MAHLKHKSNHKHYYEKSCCLKQLEVEVQVRPHGPPNDDTERNLHNGS